MGGCGWVWAYLGHRLVIVVPPLVCQRVFTVSSVVPSVEGWRGGKEQGSEGGEEQGSEERGEEERRKRAGVGGRRRGEAHRSYQIFPAKEELIF